MFSVRYLNILVMYTERNRLDSILSHNLIALPSDADVQYMPRRAANQLRPLRFRFVVFSHRLFLVLGTAKALFSDSHPVLSLLRLVRCAELSRLGVALTAVS